jgi:hypothetical protein
MSGTNALAENFRRNAMVAPTYRAGAHTAIVAFPWNNGIAQ